MTAGSDAHHVEAIGTACTVLELDDFTVAGTLAAIRKGASGLEQRYMSKTQALRKTWSNVFRLGRKRNDTLLELPRETPRSRHEGDYLWKCRCGIGGCPFTINNQGQDSWVRHMLSLSPANLLDGAWWEVLPICGFMRLLWGSGSRIFFSIC